MTDDEFWSLIEQAERDDPDEQRERLRAALMKRPAADAESFDAHVRRRLADAYRHDLWAAAYLINGGASDDGFEYFRLWLIGRGRATYEAALADPDSLAGVCGSAEDAEFESLLYLAGEVYAAKTSRTLAVQPLPSLQVPAGEGWDFDDDAAMRSRLPKLSKEYLP